MAFLTGEILEEKAHPAEPQYLAQSASVSCMHGNRHLKTCLYIPNLGVLQISFHNLDSSLAYTAPRQSRAFVAPPPHETLSITPSNASRAR